MSQKVTVEVEIKPTGDLSQQKAQVDALAKSLSDVQSKANAVSVPAQSATPQSSQPAQQAAVIDKPESAQQPAQQNTIKTDALDKFEAARNRLNRSISESSMSKEELELFDLANLDATQEQLQEISDLWDKLTAQKVELKVQGFEDAAKRQIATDGMTDDEVRLFDLENLGATEEHLQAVRNLQAEINRLAVQSKVGGVIEGMERQADTSGMKPEEVQLMDLAKLGATEEQLTRIRDLQAEIQAASIDNKIGSFEKSVERETATAGMKPEEVQIFDLQAAGATADQLERIRELQGKRTENGLAESIREVEAALRKQIATMGMSADEMQVWELKQKGATDTQVQAVQQLQAKRGSTVGGQAGRFANAAMGLGGIGLMSQAGGIGGLASQAIGGAMSGASIGSALPGLGTVAGAAIGGGIAAAGTLFGKIQEGIEGLLGPSEKFKAAMGQMADAIMRSEETIASVRSTGTATGGDFSGLDGDTRAAIMALPMSERPAAMARHADRLERDGPVSISTGGSFALLMSRFMGGDPTGGGGMTSIRTAETAEERRRLAAIATLRAGAEGGIEGVTRERDHARVGFTDASGAYDAIATMIGERSPAERTATAAEETRDAIRALGEDVARHMGLIAMLPDPRP